MELGVASDVRWRLIDSPVGFLVLAADDSGTMFTQWLDVDANRVELPGREDCDLLPDLTARIQAYFRGESVNFDDVPTPMGPGFQSRCWAACRGIPRGATISYAELARRAGSNHYASRAAGQAMRRNRLPVIIPCHRVIASSGDVGGYAGSADVMSQSLARKRYLLDLER